MLYFYSTLSLRKTTEINLRCLCLLCLSDSQPKIFLSGDSPQFRTPEKLQQTASVGQKQSLLSVPPSLLVMAITENPFFRSFKMPGRCSSILQVVHSKGLTWRYASGLELRYQKKKVHK